MRTLLVVFTAWFLVAVGVQWGHDVGQLREARRLVGAQEYVEASARAEQVLDSGLTRGLRRGAHVLLHDICKQAGDQAREAHQYAEARDWFTRIVKNPGNPHLTGYEWIARKRLEALAGEQMAYARRLEESGKLKEALDEYAAIRRDWPEEVEVLGLGRAEAACRLAYARQIMQEIPEEAVKQLATLANMSDAPPEEVERGSDMVADAAARATARFKSQRRYAEAFTFLDEACDSFRGRPDIVAALRQTSRNLEGELFGGELAGREVTDLPLERTEPSEDNMATVSYSNAAPSPVTIMVRGYQDATFALPPSTEKKVRLVPGPYVMAVKYPGMIPIRTRLDLEEADYRFSWDLRALQHVLTPPEPGESPA